MTEKRITILGEEVVIAFNMAVEIAYEEISGTTFDMDALSKTRNTVALYAATIIANNPDTKITLEDLMHKATMPEIMALRTSVLEAMAEWVKMPEVMQKDAPAEEETKKK